MSDRGPGAPEYRPIPRGGLWAGLRGTTEAALACGALRTIDTEQAFVAEAGVEFLVRSVSSLQRKADEQRRLAASSRPRGAGPFNPFLPPEPPLTVGAIGDGHLAVLNKFNVLENHLLVVTRDYEDQDRLLDEADFAALAFCLDEYPGLGFYNGGTVAGASQRHKHLQYVPLPLLPGPLELPVSPLLGPLLDTEGLQQIPAFRFPHRLVALHGEELKDPARLVARYREMLSAVGIDRLARPAGECHSRPYNLLVTRRWMLLAPRAVESCESVSVNSLGFAGSLFVRDAEEMELVRRIGPLTLLQRVVCG